jgi:uncharacterized RDD family membrane protein YckC
MQGLLRVCRLTHMKHEISLGRRFLGLSIDWLMCYAIALGFFGGSASFAERAPQARVPHLVIFFIEVLVLTAFGGATAGHRIVGLRVVQFNGGGNPTPVQALIRTVLLCLVVTAITYDENGRGIHERLSGTRLVDLRKGRK